MSTEKKIPQMRQKMGVFQNIVTSPAVALEDFLPRTLLWTKVVVPIREVTHPVFWHRTPLDHGMRQLRSNLTVETDFIWLHATDVESEFAQENLLVLG